MGKLRAKKWDWLRVLLGAAGMAGCAVVEYTAVPALLEGLAKLLQ